MTDDTMPEGAVRALREENERLRQELDGMRKHLYATERELDIALAALRPSVPDVPREPGEWDDCGDGCYVMQLLPENGKPGISFEALADGRFVYNVFGDDGSSLRRAVIPALPDEETDDAGEQ